MISGVGGLCWFVGVEGSSDGEAVRGKEPGGTSGAGLDRRTEWLPEEVRECAGGVGGIAGPLRIRLDWCLNVGEMAGREACLWDAEVSMARLYLRGVEGELAVWSRVGCGRVLCFLKSLWLGEPSVDNSCP